MTSVLNKKNFLRIKKQRPLLLLALFLIAGLVVSDIVLWKSLFGEKDLPEQNKEASVNFSAAQALPRRWLDGLEAPAGQATSSIFAVMLDNSPEGRPPAGLSSASLVWEALVEGGRTRLMAAFSLSEEVKRLGPVRSARPYFLDWAKELNAFYLHVGGSPAALNGIKEQNIFHLNEFYRGWYFWRDPQRQRPYNVFISSPSVNEAWEKERLAQNWEEREKQSWLFKKEAEEDQRGNDKASREFNFGENLVRWVYDRKANNYKRWIDGRPHLDENGRQIEAKNVVWQYTTLKVLDEVGRLEIKTVGRGQAIVMRDGREIVGVWEKNSASSRTRFFGPNGQEIQFNPGATWIEVIASQ